MTYSSISPRFAVALSVALVLALVSLAERVEARQAAPPFAPIGLINTLVAGRVALVWAPNPQGPAATSFVVVAGSAPGLSDIAIIPVGTQTSFAGDAPPGTYYVRIVAVNAAGASPPSNEGIVIVGGGGGCTVPGAPTGLVATPGASGVTIIWNAPGTGGAPAGYRIDAGSAPGASNLGTFALPNATSLTAPAPPGIYFARLRAINACGSSAPSAEVTFTIGTAALGALPAGNYSGQMFNNTRPGLGRSPITAFQLTLNQPAPATSFAQLSGRWSDNAGCVRTTGIFGGTSAGRLSLSIEQLPCNDGDMILRVTSISGNVVDGTCNGGPGCTFRMVRQ